MLLGTEQSSAAAEAGMEYPTSSLLGNNPKL